jgi:crossover junction endodeoxyribonuclease RuvC
MLILGIDPGLRNTGFGIARQISANAAEYISSGVIKTQAKDDLAQRIKVLVMGIQQLVDEFKPQLVSIEKVFVNINPQATLLLGQARGACIAACVSNNLAVYEYSALQIKQAVVGYGHAEKQQIQKMVMYLFKLNRAPQADAADALACTLAHMHYARLGKILNMATVKGGRVRQ